MSPKLSPRSMYRGWLIGVMFAVAVTFAMAGGSAAQTQQPKQPAPAQSKKPAQTKAPATPPASAPAGQQDAWVKLCEPIPGATDKKVCLTHHERIDGNTGIVVVSAAVREIEGQEKEHLLVTVPLGVVLPNGALVRVDEGKPLQLPYVFCHISGCLAEREATPEIIDSLKKGGKLGVLVVQAATKKPLIYEIPLTGFTKAMTGAPVDSEKYRDARKKLMLAIRERQIELAKKAAEAAKNKDGGAQQPQQQAQPPKQQ